jgi:uroporphyrinogen-III synthase
VARVLITRAEEAGAKSIARLAARGHEAVYAPLTTIRATGAELPAGPFDAVVVASGNAVRVLPRDVVTRLAETRLFAVGERTADVARATGFARVHSADGDRRDLAAKLAADLKPASRLLVLAGQDRHLDLEKFLREAGHEVSVAVTYAAEEASALPETARAALGAGDVDAVLHYSPRSARLFVAGARNLFPDRALTAPRHVCLSAEVAEALPVEWRSGVHIAARPDEEALFAALDEAVGHPAKATKRQDSVATSTPTEETAMADTPDGAGAAKEPGRKPGPTIELKAERVEETPPATEPPKAAADEPVAAAEGKPDEPTAAQPAEPSLQSPPPSGGPRRLLPFVAAGLVGAIVAATALIAPRLQSGGERPEVLARRIETRIAAVEQKAAPADALAAVSKRIEDMAVGSQREQAAASALTTRLSALEEAARKLAERPAPAGDPPALAGLTERLTKLEAALASRDPAAARALAESLADRLTRAEAALAAIKPGVEPKEVADLSARIDQLASRAEALAMGLQAVEPQVKQSLAPAEKRLAELAERLAAAEAAVKGQGASLVAADAVRRRALAEALVGAFHRGQPYKEMLDGLARLGLAEERAKALAPFAGNGAPRAADLARRFSPIAGPLAATGAPPRGDSVGERLSASFANLVRIRPVDGSGGDPAALVARIERALAGGSVADALAAWEALPAAAREKAKDFGDLLAARVAAEKAASDLYSETLRGLAEPKG